VLNNQRNIANAVTPSARPQAGCILAPAKPLVTGTGIQEKSIALVGVYPNPAIDQALLQFNTTFNGNVWIELIDAAGKVVNRKQVGVHQGLNYAMLQMNDLSAGVYQVVITGNDFRTYSRIVKH
jgi:hypothetical protein